MEQMDEIASSGEKEHTGSDGAKIQGPSGLLPKDLRSQGLMERSDAEGLLQLLFHLFCLWLCGFAVSLAVQRGSLALLLLAELPFGVAFSFLFNGFHEMVHNTAFATQGLNTALAQVLGFFIFRGANWFWCFHWAHHRFTNDPARDPELSGGSLDLDDPTRSPAAYVAFLSGYPFGLERVPRMLRLALGQTGHDPWVAEKPAATQRLVRREAAAYCAGYGLLALGSLLFPRTLGLKLLLYWLLPHCLGAGHLRAYQFAEHRACQMGPYTDTNAWVCSRTTYTWWLYRKMAWHMPYHVEHHAYPSVPFHKLQEAHEILCRAYAKEGRTAAPTGCDPDGRIGYLRIHARAFLQMLGNHARAAKAA